MPLSVRDLKQGVYGELARMGKAFGSAVRLEILDLLCQSPKTVEQLAKETCQSVANTSQHLQTLKASGVIKSERQGNHVVYSIANRQVAVVWSHFRVLGESTLSEIKTLTQQFFAQRESLEKLTEFDLVQQVAAGNVLLLDVRPKNEYDEAHLDEARSIPLDSLLEHIDELPQDKTIVAYCRGRLCMMAVEAVNILRSRGFHAIRLEDSVADWQAKGLPVFERRASGQN